MIQKIGKKGGQLSTYNWKDGVSSFNAEVYSFVYTGIFANQFKLVQEGLNGTALFALKSSGGRKYRIKYKIQRFGNTKNVPETIEFVQNGNGNQVTTREVEAPVNDNCESFQLSSFGKFVSIPGGGESNEFILNASYNPGGCLNDNIPLKKKLNFIRATGVFVVRAGDLVQINNQPTDSIYGSAVKLFP